MTDAACDAADGVALRRVAMKLASLRDGGPDGRLVVVTRDLTLCSDARHIAPTLAAALAAWDEAAPELALIARGLEAGAQPVERFHERAACAPLPRQGALVFTDPRGRLPFAAAAGPEPEVAVLTGPVPRGAEPAAALAAIRLVALRLGSAFAPVAVTPDELGAAWAHGRLGGVLMLGLNGSPHGRTDAGGMRADFGTLIAAAAAEAELPVGSIVASGPLPGKRPARSPRVGDTLRLEMQDADGRSIFGAIEQAIVPAAA
jgi:fumarylacetoacetate (FAA) hydrolase